VYRFCQRYYRPVPPFSATAVVGLDCVTRVPVALLGAGLHAANEAAPEVPAFHTHFLPPFLSAECFVVDVLVYAAYSALDPTGSFRVCGVECLACFPEDASDDRVAVVGRPVVPAVWVRRVRGRV
jgi:hypothetical protein